MSQFLLVWQRLLWQQSM